MMYLLGGAGLVLILLMGWMFLGGKSLSATQEPGVPVSTVASNCPVAENLQLYASDYAKAGTGATVTAIVYGPDGKIVTTSLSNNTNLGVTGGLTYTLLVDGTNMFAEKVTKTMSCSGNQQVTASIPQADTGATITFVNSDGVTVNAVGANETVTTGQAIDPTIKIKNAVQDKFVTSPYCGQYLITVKFSNVSAWDLSKSTIQGCVSHPVPVAEAGASHQAFLCSAPDGVVNKFQGDIRAVHLALLSSGDVYSLASYDINTFKVYPLDNVVNSKTGVPLGCVPENDVGTASQTAITSGGIFYMK
jgi:hypothetical protein